MDEKLGHSKISSSISKWDRKCTLLFPDTVQKIIWADCPFCSAWWDHMGFQRLWPGSTAAVGIQHLWEWDSETSSWVFPPPVLVSGASCPICKDQSKNKWKLDGKLPDWTCTLAELGSLSQSVERGVLLTGFGLNYDKLGNVKIYTISMG